MLKFIAGLMVGICTLPIIALIGMNGFASRVNETLDRPLFVQPVGDDLEAYRACLTISYDESRPARAALDACQFPLSEWAHSPTFENEWNELLATDTTVAMIVGESYLESIPKQ